MDSKLRELLKRANKLKSYLKSESEVLVVSHIDADGITSAAIALQTLERMGIDCKYVFLKQLDAKSFEKILNENRFTLFVDLGSGYISEIIRRRIRAAVIDHHYPELDKDWQLNPNIFGFDGASECSTSSLVYLFSRTIGLNYDLSPLAIVGAVGDLQDREGKLIGLNRLCVEDGVKNKLIEVIKDLRFFGKQTRPVFKMLEYTFDPYLPGISGSEKGSIEFLNSIGIKLKENGKWRRWIDLSRPEKKVVLSEIVKICISSGYPFSSIKNLVGEVYLLRNEREGTEVKDAMEFSTLLNATARYGYEEIGLKVCLGDRNKAYKKAVQLLRKHRKNLSEGLKVVDEVGIVELDNIQYFHAGNRILDTIVGIIAGMSFFKANLEKPIIAFAINEDGVKVSARATRALVEKGLHLAEAIKKAAEIVGGSGGGHSIAAGAQIPRGKEYEFLEELDRIIGNQLRKNV